MIELIIGNEALMNMTALLLVIMVIAMLYLVVKYLVVSISRENKRKNLQSLALSNKNKKLLTASNR